MERPYTKNELENKKLPELKEIAKQLQVKATGKKADIIDNILNGKLQITKPTTKSYFDLLPGDINKMVNKYQLENDINKKILEYLLYDTLAVVDILDYARTSKSREDRHEKLEKIFKDNGLEIYIVLRKNVKNPHPSIYNYSLFVFEYGNPGPVSDLAIKNILPIFSYDDIDQLNFKLQQLKSKFRIVVIPGKNGKGREYELVEINNAISFGNEYKLA